MNLAFLRSLASLVPLLFFVMPAQTRADPELPLQINKILGDYRIYLDQYNDIIEITDEKKPNKLLLSGKLSEFITSGIGEVSIEERRGSFKVTDENFTVRCENAKFRLNQVTFESVSLQGYFDSRANGCEIKFLLRFSYNERGHLQINTSSEKQHYNYWELAYRSDPKEQFYGFGEQFSYLSLKGQKVPVLVREQGIGRGHPIITPLVNLTSDGWSGGNKLSSYVAIPQYISSFQRGFYLENSAYSEFDLSHNRRVKIRLFDFQVKANLFSESSYLDLIESYSRWSGKMRHLPNWVHSGAILGVQGGTDKIREILALMDAHQVELSALWLQDWVGQRATSVGSQLWWNWELDRGHYFEWQQLLSELEHRGIRVLGYINPFLVNVAGDSMDDPDYPIRKEYFERNLFEEALSKGFLVENIYGQPYRLLQTSFGAGLLDLSNPKARRWIKDVIKDNLVGSGLSGWMADFAESLPFDGQIFQGEAHEYHNLYPEQWAAVNREAIAELNRGDEILTFHRSGFSKSPKYVGLFWQGDQMVTWDKHDGLRSSLLGLIGGGFSGLSLNHSDIGGYSGFKSFGLGYSREKSLLIRWMEMNAFTTALRSHEGNQPDKNWQVYSDKETLEHFSRNSKIYKALMTYRKRLVKEASEKGWPVVRHPMLHYPDDSKISTLVDQFMLGSELMVCPILSKNGSQRRCYLPEGHWTHLWSGKEINSSGKAYKIKAPMGQMPVFFPSNSSVGVALRQELKHLSLIP